LQVERPVTPPKQAEEEVKMEESPTREVQQANKLNFTGFSFGTPPTTGSVLFGGPTSAPPATTTPFPFGGASSGPFGAPPMKESKSEGPKPFTFHQSSSPVPPTGTGFTFGQTTQTAESPRPSTTGSYGFSPSTPASTTTGFTFGAAQPTSNVFGQQQSGGSAPSSPSTFQATFNFGGTSSGTGTGFGFGSQPASPATGTSNLPQTPFGGGTTGFGSSAPSSPFSAPIQITPSTSSGGTLFTIGAPPPPQPGGTQGRAIKKLPNRSRIKR
jgi:nucleoporin NUP1